jgi:hypothetical protein
MSSAAVLAASLPRVGPAFAQSPAAPLDKGPVDYTVRMCLAWKPTQRIQVLLT